MSARDRVTGRQRDLLLARDAREALRADLCARARGSGRRTVVLVSTAIPGADKRPSGIDRVIAGGTEALLAECPDTIDDAAGADALGPYRTLVSSSGADEVKLCAVAIEGRSAAARLLDIDVYEADGRPVDRRRLGLPPRRCLLCDQPAADCIRTRRHAAEDLARAVRALLESAPLPAGIDARAAGHPRSAAGFPPPAAATAADTRGAPITVPILADALVAGAYAELRLTPKPGLVDRRDNGSHPDLSFELMARSVALLPAYFDELARHRLGGSPLPACIDVGRRAEIRMANEVGGNAHRGYIFGAGLVLLAACDGALGLEALRTGAARTAREFFALRQEGPDAARLARGIERETAAGLPSVFDVGLPDFLRQLERGRPFTTAAWHMMARLMQVVDDTTTVRRCGLLGLARLRRDGADLERRLDRGADCLPFLEHLNGEYRAARMTMGGVADLMAVTLALFFVTNPGHAITAAEGHWVPSRDRADANGAARAL